MSTAHSIGVVALIEPGVIAWSKTLGYEGVGEDDRQLEPVGGVVVEVIDTPDPETGELERSFRVLDPYRTRPRLTWHVLRESDVDRETVTVAPPSTIASLVRRLCEEVAIDSRKRPRRGLFMPEHVNLVVTAWRLAGLL